ncbi:MAG: DUF1579 domain-containing protein [Planctomycetes bacterium]|nr:DUF1579 domain-containing protein [Planctomycetota bacterium]
MRQRMLALLAATLFAAGCASTKGAEAPRKEPAPAAAASGEPSAAEMEAWQKAMALGEEHRRMAAECGEWTAAGKMWMAAGAPPTESTSEATIRMIHGGRFQVMDFRGDFMGMPFEGTGITGFDNVTKEYTSVWVDSMNTGTMITRGKATGPGRIELTGSMKDPMGDLCNFRQVLVSTGGTTIVMEMHVQGDKVPVEYKCMEIVFTKRK